MFAGRRRVKRPVLDARPAGRGMQRSGLRARASREVSSWLLLLLLASGGGRQSTGKKLTAENFLRRSVSDTYPSPSERDPMLSLETSPRVLVRRDGLFGTGGGRGVGG